MRYDGDLDQLEGTTGEVEHNEDDEPFAARNPAALKIVDSQAEKCDEDCHQDYIEAKLRLDAVHLLLSDLRPH